MAATPARFSGPAFKFWGTPHEAVEDCKPYRRNLNAILPGSHRTVAPTSHSMQ
jgi:hypothetical protein